MVECLAALRAPVDEQDQVVILLCSLPVKYKSLMTAYMAKGEVQMAELREALISHKAHVIELSGSADTGLKSALWTGGRSKKAEHMGCCYKCGSPGHLSWHCRVPRSRRSAEKPKQEQSCSFVAFDEDDDSEPEGGGFFLIA